MLKSDINIQLLTNASKGNRKAQYELYKFCFDLLMPICFRYTRNEEFAGNYGNKTINYRIGEDNYFMETDYEKRIRPNGTAFYTIKSFLSPKSLPGTPNSLQLILCHNTLDTLTSSFNVDSVFYAGRKIRISDNYSDSTNELVVFYGDSDTNVNVAISSTVPQENLMTIHKVESFQNNDKGQKTVKVSFSLESDLANHTGMNPKEFDVTGTFAFDYPN